MRHLLGPRELTPPPDPPASSPAPALAGFDPIVADWFGRRFRNPTEIQRLAWPRVLAGEHVLFTAPTGSGKTLAGFLCAIDGLLSGRWAVSPEGGVRVLYISPLKALNADIERNLRAPLAELEAAFEAAGRHPPPIRVGVRSGDTSAAERARMLRRPPEILITTPESLNLLLLSQRAPALFGGLRLAILDEIHALYGTKRGVHLITAVERLTRVAGEFQRVAISATVRPLEEVARFVGGRRVVPGLGGLDVRGGPHTDTRFEPRPVAVVEAPPSKRYELAVRFPFGGLGPGEIAEQRSGDAFWRRVSSDLAARIAEVRSTIVFTNSRRMAEKVTRFVNEAAGRELAWSHHGSLSREIRTAVEARLKEGRLPAIVATSSLELGIDVGALDRVVLLQSPRSLASAAQRIGRSGHRAGEASRAIFYPTHPRDFLDAAVMTRGVLDGVIEPLRPIRAPLDLLAQLVLSMVAHESWRLDDLFDAVRAAAPYHELSRRQFDLVVEMLAGRYADARLEELRPRVIVDRIDGTIVGRPGLARLLARAGGTIPDRGYYQLRLEESRALLGELDEEFVWERAIGDSFNLGTQSWRIRAITANEVLVVPARGGPGLAPFWRADARDRNAFVSERVGRFLEEADRRLGEPELERDLVERFAFEPEAAAELLRQLVEEKLALGTALPHRRHLVFEEAREVGGGSALGVDSSDASATRRQVVLYTFWGGTVNRPLSLALAALWEEQPFAHGERIQILSDDDALLFLLPGTAGATEARALLEALVPERIDELLRRKLESSGFFGALFRQNAQRALLLPRAAPGRRTPLWIHRQNAKRLLEAVESSDDFPILVETWRDCLQDEFELDVLRERLRELATGELRVSRAMVERPTPFAAGLVWQRTNELMYEDDVSSASRPRTAADLVREVALDAHGDRPRIPARLVERHRRTVQRLLPGYPPGDAAELLDWVRERLWIPADEWRELLAAIDAESRPDEGGGAPAPSARWLAEIAPKLVVLRAGTTSEAIAALETASIVADALFLANAFASARTLDGERLAAPPLHSRVGEISSLERRGVSATARWLRSWLRFEPPLVRRQLASLAGIDGSDLDSALVELERAGEIVRGELTEGVEGVEGESFAALSSFETLLRWRRAAARPELRPLPLAVLPLWLASRQGLTTAATGRSSGVELQHALDPLLGSTAPAALWETEILPARLDPYRPTALDTLVAESDLGWLGVGRERTTFAFSGDFDLFPAASDTGPRAEKEAERVVSEALASSTSGLDLAELEAATGFSTEAITAALWSLAWRGEATHETYRVLRRGIASDFRAEPVGESPGIARPRGGGRAAFRRWSTTRAFGGRWRAIARAAAGDPLAEEERNRERVRRLALRHGVLFRELLALELPALSWSRLARSIRALELGGELVAGRFFDGIPGPQFAPASSLGELQDGPPSGACFWHAANDPASCCGIELVELKRALPHRRSGTWLVWRGSALVAVARRGGAELDVRLPSTDVALAEIAAPYRNALARAVSPERSIELETINGEAAATSPYLGALEALSRTRESQGRVRLRRSYTERSPESAVP